jgi:phage-related protein
VIYFARRAEKVYALPHAFQKKTQKTPNIDLEIAKPRFGQIALFVGKSMDPALPVTYAFP